MIRSLLPVFALSLALLSGCGTSPKAPDADSVTSGSAADAETLIQLARNAGDRSQEARYLLQAAEQFRLEGQLDQTEAILSLIDVTGLEREVREQYLLISLQLASNNYDLERMQSLLDQSLPDDYQFAPVEVQRTASELKATAYEMLDDTLAAAKQRIGAAALYSDEAYWANQEKIWRLISRTPTAELSQATEAATDYESRGWLELGTAIKQNQYSLEQQLQALNSWQQAWADHPAAQRLPEELELLTRLPEYRPSNIALALPLSGKFARTGQAIRDGFLAAHYADPHYQTGSTRIRFIDTATRDFQSIYSDLLTEETDLVIGPLSKSTTESLAAEISLPVTTMALNYGNEGNYPPPQLYQFGLSPEDELKQIAEHMNDQGMRRVLMLAPASAWGQRLTNAFSLQWESEHSNTSILQLYDPAGDLSKAIAAALEVDKSEARARELRRTIGQFVEFKAQRRFDVDAVVLVASPETARQIKPLLAFYYAGDVPVFATSSIYSGAINPGKDSDLNGVTFTETPWILNQTNALKQAISTAIPDSPLGYERLYALGVDAYHLSPRLVLLEKIEGSQMQGETGQLSMNEIRQIRRKLDWARFQRGKPQITDTN